MRTILRGAMIIVAIAGMNGCSKGGDSAEQSKAGTMATQKASGGDAGAGHGVAGAVPGSYEDWCGEHGVPESVCTRCNATLIAAFKATGDWCAEHGLPESQCLACNPDLKIERPPKPTGS